MILLTTLRTIRMKRNLVPQNNWFIFLISILLISSTISYTANRIRNINSSETDTSIVEKYGQLRVEGNKMVDKNGDPVSLRGMSLFWSQWMGKYYNFDCIKWLRDDWQCTVIRAAMGIESGGYLQNPVAEKNKIITVINACIDLGIYVIVDWHDHNAHNHQQEAIDFFTEIAEQYGEYPNIIYEIYNEPMQVSWNNVVKPYADTVVSSIRAIDPDNIIIVGTPTWSQDVDVASQNPLDFENIVYALHFYAATHKQSLRNKATTALHNGIALFVSEFGTCESSGDGPIDSIEVERWMNFMEANRISWCNWAIDDKDETSAALMPGASANGGWSESDLSESGSLVRDKIILLYDTTYTDVETPIELPLNFKLNQNYPNPFNPITNIGFVISDFGLVKLKVYDILGNEVATLVNEYKSAGSYEVEFNGQNLPSGVYFYQLKAGSNISTKKLILLK